MNKVAYSDACNIQVNLLNSGYFIVIRTWHTHFGQNCKCMLLTIGTVLYSRSPGLTHLKLLKLYAYQLSTPYSLLPLPPGNYRSALGFSEYRI